MSGRAPADPNDPYPEPIVSELVTCPRCGGSGFEGRGTGYGDVCSECGGQRQLPQSLLTEDEARQANDNAWRKASM